MSSLTEPGVAREGRQGAYQTSTDRTRLDLKLIHNFLKGSYWASGIPAEVVERSAENTLVFGLYKKDEQVGLARVVTDYSSFAYLADVFVMELHSGRGPGRWMMEVVFSHPELQGFRRWLLVHTLPCAAASGRLGCWRFTGCCRTGFWTV